LNTTPAEGESAPYEGEDDSPGLDDEAAKPAVQSIGGGDSPAPGQMLSISGRRVNLLNTRMKTSQQRMNGGEK